MIQNITAPLRVLVTSTSFPANKSDWRGIFIKHLVEALARREDLQISLWAPPGCVSGDIRFEASLADRDMLKGLMSDGGIAHLLRNQPVTGTVKAIRLLAGLRRAFMSSEADVFHVNWLQSAIALPRNSKPAVVTALGSDLQFLRLPGVRGLVGRALRNRAVAICPNAVWMEQELQETFGKVAMVSAVPFGIDEGWYSIRRHFERQPYNEWIVVSRITRGKLGALLEWAEPMFSGTSRRLNVLGPMQEDISLPSWIHYHGVAPPSELKNRWFPEATGLLSLSRHSEGMPQVMLEAMAAGIPVVASRLPAHESLIEDRVNGWLVDSQDQLKLALEELEAPKYNVSIGAAAKQTIQNMYGTWADCASRYREIYREIA